MGLIVVAAGLGLLLGLGQSEERRFERAAASEISSKLGGEEKKVRVNVRPHGVGALQGDLTVAQIFAERFTLDELPLFTEPDRNPSGRIRSLQLRLTEFRLRGLLVQSLEADIPECRYDFDLARRERTIRLARSGQGTGSVTVRGTDLAEWIDRKYAEIKECQVTLEDGWVRVDGYGEFVIVKSRFSVLAKLVSPDGRRVMLDRARITFDGVPADPMAAKVLLDVMNPVVDLDADLGLYGAVNVETIRAENGLMIASGRTQIPEKPAENTGI